jgi:hypothetical protein
MVAAFGRQKVAANFHRSTLADKHVFERRKKCAKDREVYYTQYSPAVDLVPEVLAAGTAACSAGGEVQRCFSVLSRTVALCEIHHAVGDVFVGANVSFLFFMI